MTCVFFSHLYLILILDAHALWPYCCISHRCTITYVTSNGTWASKYLVNHLRRITLVFACLQCNQYTIANIYNLHVLTYHQEERRLPFVDLLVNDVGLFSEEAGEIAFSLLARSTLGDSVEDKHSHLANNFCALEKHGPHWLRER